MATLKDIAKDCGFSVSVVSRALNPHPDQQVAAETKRRIEASMRKLNYRRNHTASLLARGRSIAIGVFLPRYRDTLITELVFGISAAAIQYDFQCNYYFGMNANDYLRFFDQLNDAGSSGILTYHFDNGGADHRLADAFEKYRNSGGHVILLNTPECNNVHDTIFNINNHAGGMLAAKHLLECGCKSFCCIAPATDSFMQNTRCSGFAEKLAEHGFAVKQIRVPFCNFQEYDAEVLSQTVRMLASDEKVGIFASSDYLALLLIRELHRNDAGNEIGKRIHIVGFDNMPAATFSTPALSTISQPFYHLGYISMAHLIATITGENPPDTKVPEPELIVRASSSPEKN